MKINKIIDWYINNLIKITGGNAIWGDFKKEVLVKLILFCSSIVGVGKVSGLFIDEKLLNFSAFSAFFVLFFFGVLGLLSKSFQSYVLVIEKRVTAPRMGFYLMIYTGFVGCVIALLL